jgi:hypothetical protein
VGRVGTKAQGWMVKAFGIWMNAVRRGARVAVLSVAAVLVVRWSHVAAAVPPPLPSPTPAGRDSLTLVSGAPTHVTMRNVDFHVGDGVLLRIAMLDGHMQSVKHGVVDFDDKRSYVLSLDTGAVALTPSDLTNLMNRYVFSYPGAPLSNLSVTVRGDQLGLKGTLHKGVDIPFDITSTVTLTPDEKLRIHPTRMRIFSVNGLALMRALGLNLKKMIDLSKAKGVTAEGNDLLMDPLVILPPPVIRGRLTLVRIERGAMTQYFGRAATGAEPSPMTLPDTTLSNYMLYRGGVLHFGKLYMTDAELIVVDEDARDPFDFDNDHYQRQLIAGHSRTLPSLGLEVYMPDAAKLGRAGGP